LRENIDGMKKPMPTPSLRWLRREPLALLVGSTLALSLTLTDYARIERIAD
jgi:hypothetical protein